MLKILDKDNFKDETQKGVKLVEFFTTWCGYCKKQQPELEEMDKVWIGQVDADKSPAIAANYKVNSFPTFLILKDGEEVERFSGYHKKENLMNKVIKYI